MGAFCYNKAMKLYVFSDDDLSDFELDMLARIFVMNERRRRHKPAPKRITDDDVIDLAVNLDLSVEQIQKIMKRKPKR